MFLAILGGTPSLERDEFSISNVIFSGSKSADGKLPSISSESGKDFLSFELGMRMAGSGDNITNK